MVTPDYAGIAWLAHKDKLRKKYGTDNLAEIVKIKGKKNEKK